MSIQRFIQVTAAGLVFAGAYLAFQSTEPARASESELDIVETLKISAPATSIKDLKGDAAKPLAKAEKPEKSVALSNMLTLPDGSKVPILNGAYGAPAMTWPDERPWSPIVSKVTDPDGIEWYFHEDGSRSTTQNVYYSHLGGMAPLTNVNYPIKTLAMAPGEVAEVLKQQARQKVLKDGKKKVPGKE